MLVFWWLIFLSVGLSLAVRWMVLPWWADFLIGLAGGVGLLWGCALVLCHRGTVVLRWTQRDEERDEATGGPRAPRRTS